MNYYSTSGSLQPYTLSEAVLNGLPDDSGLFMPEILPVLPSAYFNNLHNLTFPEIAFEIAHAFLKDDVSKEVLHTIVNKAVNFSAPVVALDEHTKILELFHGPTLAFKDFGARFMAQLMSHLVKDQDQKLTILVATSGDTGGAVANGFYRTEGIEVIILYPSGKVSPLQEKQLTTLGENITALEIQGTFDDCQKLVKTAFHDIDLLAKYHLSSANSINISRLIPQTFYYIEAFKQVQDKKMPVVFSVPSGNFGNLTAGILAKKMGLPVNRFIASVNANDVFTNYLYSGDYLPRTSVQTLSNAMDVGAPSNFARLLSIYKNDIAEMRKDITSYSFSDKETTHAMKEVHSKFNYTMDPHGAVAYLGWKKHKELNIECQGIILETAHPSKFIETVEDVLQIKQQIPVELSSLADKNKSATLLPTEYNSFKEFLLNR